MADFNSRNTHRIPHNIHLRLVDDAAVGQTDLQRQIAEMPLHRIDDHPQRDHQAIEQQQGAHKRNQLRVAQHFVLAHAAAAAVREDAVHAIRFREHGAEGQREAGRQQIDASLRTKQGE